MSEIKLRPSAARSWMDCSARQEYIELNPEDDDVYSVALVVGVETHDEFADQPPQHYAWNDPGKAIAYDDITPTERAKERVVRNLAAKAKTMIHNMNVANTLAVETLHEVVYTYPVGEEEVKIRVRAKPDVVVEFADGRVGPVDLKTGMANPKTAIEQVAVYTAAFADSPPEGMPKPNGGGVFWVPRNRAGLVGEMVWWDIKRLQTIASHVMMSVAHAAVYGGRPNPSSRFCKSCPRTGCHFHPSRDGDD